MDVRNALPTVAESDGRGVTSIMFRLMAYSGQAREGGVAMPTQIFISHITEDAAVATRLKQQLLEDFLRQFTVFQSSDTESIAAGEIWFSSISKAIRDSSLFIILCSPIAITRPWVNFEAGAAWMQDLPLIPTCFDGLRPRGLPMPLSAYQGLELNDAQGGLFSWSRRSEVR
jgi:hypothetical protein